MIKSTSTILLLAAAFQRILAVPATSNSFHVVQTTVYNGMTIDWVAKESQGDIATPPPSVKSGARSGANILDATFDYPPKGPNGTVPIARTDEVKLPPKRLPQPSDHWNASNTNPKEKRQNLGKHWYASSNQNVNNLGGQAQVNIWPMYTQYNGDFSLMQVAVIRDSPKGTQTVEAGFQHCEIITSGGPALFTYFTTNGYKRAGDNMGGYNRKQQGWVQVSDKIFPGIHFSKLSSYGGPQYQFTMTYMLYENNWWLYVLDSWIGYYPASLFAAGTNAGQSLAAYGNAINFYGEVYNSAQTVTTTDMGSGNFPNRGDRQAAYMRNILYFSTVGGKPTPYVPNGYVISDKNRYDLEAHWNSGTDKGSYMYLGGPGAGGVVNG